MHLILIGGIQSRTSWAQHGAIIIIIIIIIIINAAIELSFGGSRSERRQENHTDCRREIWRNETTWKTQELSNENIKIYNKNGMWGRNLIHVVQEKGKQQAAAVDTIMNLRVPQNAGCCLTI
jgi:hypothetical protein